jgi:hypothetical protein
VRFSYGELMLPDDQTGKDLGMVSGDIVDVLVTQQGTEPCTLYQIACASVQRWQVIGCTVYYAVCLSQES